MLEEMKAGPELDRILCELLERRPKLFAYKKTWALDGATSKLGFWTWQAWGAIWRAIPVSTDWAAMGKAAEELSVRGYHVEIDLGVTEPPMNYIRARVGDGLIGLYFVGNTGPHAFALAAVDALEKKREAV